MSIHYLGSPQGPGINGCTCTCHKTSAKVYHCVPCCPTEDRRTLLQRVQEVNNDHESEFQFRTRQDASYG